jgi:agmatinase
MDKPNIDTAITRKSAKGQIGEVSYFGVTSFARCKYTKDLTDVDVAITGIPFDASVTHRNGSRLGPRLVLISSLMFNKSIWIIGKIIL